MWCMRRFLETRSARRSPRSTTEVLRWTAAQKRMGQEQSWPVHSFQCEDLLLRQDGGRVAVGNDIVAIGLDLPTAQDLQPCRVSFDGRAIKGRDSCGSIHLNAFLRIVRNMAVLDINGD